MQALRSVLRAFLGGQGACTLTQAQPLTTRLSTEGHCSLHACVPLQNDLSFPAGDTGAHGPTFYSAL